MLRLSEDESVEFKREMILAPDDDDEDEEELDRDRFPILIVGADR